MVNTGSANIVAFIGACGLSQPFTVCVTYHVVVPGVVPKGLGAIGDPVPEADVYHSRLLPTAVSGAVAEYWQYSVSDTIGAGGVGYTVKVPVPGKDGQPFSVATAVYVPELETVTGDMDGFCNVETKLSGPVQL